MIARLVVLRDRRAATARRLFVVAADVDRDAAAKVGLDPLAVPVVGEAGRDPTPVDRREPVFGVPSLALWSLRRLFVAGCVLVEGVVTAGAVTCVVQRLAHHWLLCRP